MEYIFLNQFSFGESYEVTVKNEIVTIKTLMQTRTLGRQMSLEFLYQIEKLNIESWDSVYYPPDIYMTEADFFGAEEFAWELICKKQGGEEHLILGRGGYPKEWHFFLSLLDFFQGIPEAASFSESSENAPAFPTVFDRMKPEEIEKMIRYEKAESNASLAMEDADEETKHHMLINLLVQLQGLDFQLTSQLDTFDTRIRLNYDEVKSVSVQYNATLDWLDHFLTDPSDIGLCRTANDIYKKIFVMYYLNAEQGYLIQRAPGTETYIMHRTSANWLTLSETQISEEERSRIFADAELITRQEAVEIEDMWNFLNMQYNLNADAAGYLGQVWVN